MFLIYCLHYSSLNYSDQKPHHELEGDIEALNLIDLSSEDLGQYSNYLNKPNETAALTPQNTPLASASTLVPTHAEDLDTDKLISLVFQTIDVGNNGRITLDDAKQVFAKLNARFNRNYGERDVATFFELLSDAADSRTLTYDQFRGAFMENFFKNWAPTTLIHTHTLND